MVVDELARRHDGSFRSKFSGQLAEVRLDGLRLALLKPETYMNLSGNALGSAARFFKTPVESIAVVHDDVDLEPGRLQVRLGGGLAGHNGLRSIKGGARLGRIPARPRRRRPPRPRRPPAGRRLRPLAVPAGRGRRSALVARAADAVETLAREGLDAAQRGFN